MPKRTLAVLAAAAFGALALPFGLPTIAHATGPAYDSLNVRPLPLEQPGMLMPTGDNTVTVCVQPTSAGSPVVGAEVFLSIDSGLFTAPAAAGGTATADGTPLTGTPQSFTVTSNTCNWANQEGGGTLSDAIPVTYTGPAPTVPVNGRDVIAATSDGTSFDASTGQCTGAGVCATATYVFSPVMSYTFSGGATIAPTGSLAAGQQVTFTVQAQDSTSHPVPGAFIDLSLVPSTGGSVGTAMAVNILNGKSKTKQVTNLPTRFGADNNGDVSVTYTAANPLPTNGDTDTVTAQNHPTYTVHNHATYTYSGSSTPPTAEPYTAITPFRVCDTRPVAPGIAANQCNNASNPAGFGPLNQTPRVLTIQGFGSPAVPAGATAVVLNVAAVAPSARTFLTVFPDLQTRPNTANINLAAGAVVDNLVVVGLSAAGKVDVFNDVGTTNLTVDIEGYMSSGSTGLFNSVAPTRICDTRLGVGIPSNECNGFGTHESPIVAGSPLTFSVHTPTDGIPASGVSAVVFNLSGIAPSKPTFLTAYPGPLPPTAANLNLNPGQALPNRVIVPVSNTGTVTILNSVGSINVAVDIEGWFQTTGGASFTPITPFRVCNTQFGNIYDGGETNGCIKATVPAGTSLNISVTGIGGVPQEVNGQAGSPVAVVLNVTAVNASTGTFVTVFPGPDTDPHPNASDLSVAPTWPVGNLVVAGVDQTDGTINLFNDLGNVNLIVDIYGYYS
jgi:hypothetical protein